MTDVFSACVHSMSHQNTCGHVVFNRFYCSSLYYKCFTIVNGVLVVVVIVIGIDFLF